MSRSKEERDEYFRAVRALSIAADNVNTIKGYAVAELMDRDLDFDKIELYRCVVTVIGWWKERLKDWPEDDIRREIHKVLIGDLENALEDGGFVPESQKGPSK